MRDLRQGDHVRDQGFAFAQAFQPCLEAQCPPGESGCKRHAVQVKRLHQVPAFRQGEPRRITLTYRERMSGALSRRPDFFLPRRGSPLSGAAPKSAASNGLPSRGPPPSKSRRLKAGRVYGAAAPGFAVPTAPELAAPAALPRPFAAPAALPRPLAAPAALDLAAPAVPELAAPKGCRARPSPAATRPPHGEARDRRRRARSSPAALSRGVSLLPLCRGESLSYRFVARKNMASVPGPECAPITIST